MQSLAAPTGPCNLCHLKRREQGPMQKLDPVRGPIEERESVPLHLKKTRLKSVRPVPFNEKYRALQRGPKKNQVPV
jgi:hypothetical protein